ncbi:MAG: spore coat U domain-containing protein [Candidatus Eremiobacteraeota bacterium]|nr:spore coat U domain-containing protein [Candidatus Eremiobacteraeota bacterium]
MAIAFASLPVPAKALCVTCSVAIAAASVPFGNYDPAQTGPTMTTGTVLLTATGTVGASVPVVVALSTGSGTYSSRVMRFGTSTLSYNVNVSPSGAVFGDGTSGTATVAVGLTVMAVPVTVPVRVYATIPAGQRVIAGPYADTLAVTVNF